MANMMSKLIAGLGRASAATFKSAGREASKGLGNLFWVLLAFAAILFVVGRIIMFVAIVAAVIFGLWLAWHVVRALYELTQHSGSRDDRLNRPGPARRNVIADAPEH